MTSRLSVPATTQKSCHSSFQLIMATNDDGKAATAAPEDASKPTPNRKRRLSKKERKNLKKKQKKSNNKVSSKQPNYTSGYIPIPLPPEIDDAEEDVSKGAKKMGKWFPTAVVVKTQTVHNSVTTPHKKKKKKKKAETSADDETRTSSLVLFYQYANPPFRQSQVRQLMAYLTSVAKIRNLGGRIRVSNEGVNCTVSSLDATTTDAAAESSSSASSPTSTAAANLRLFALDLQHFSPVFKETYFKYIDNLPPDRHFKELKIMPVKELVYYGISEKDAPLSEGGVHLEAKEYHKMLGRDDAVVIDVRNHYEALIGRFDGQCSNSGRGDDKKKESVGCKKNDDDDSDDDGSSSKKDQEMATSKKDTKSTGGGATYIDPMMRKSTDFPDWLSKPETKEKLAHKKVLMFCTGGVRCERASAYLKKQMGDKVDGVFQLQGGIERYMQVFKDGGYWRGKNFVFDKREAVGVENAAGDGGVVKKQKQGAASLSDSQHEEARCCYCSTPWNRYVGKRKCDFCGVPVLMCDACMTTRKAGKSKLDIRCDLCKQEGVTVPANEVIWTDNGVHGRATSTSSHANSDGAAGKAASSVLKWGGGHAVEKKKARKLGRIPCRFGSECSRKDCLFLHPEKMKGGKTAL